MKVKELIESLKAEDPEAEVMCGLEFKEPYPKDKVFGEDIHGAYADEVKVLPIGRNVRIAGKIKITAIEP